MRAAVVASAGKGPTYGEFPEPAASGAGEARINVTASALSHVTRSRAAGGHYSAAATFPFVPGIDGAGRLDDGRRVYFILPRAPWGGMAERTVAPASNCVQSRTNSTTSLRRRLPTPACRHGQPSASARG